MVRFFSTLLVFLCLGATSVAAQNIELTEEAISKYISDTKETLESLSEDRYEEWVRTYLNHESDMQITTWTRSEGRAPTESVLKLNHKQYLSMLNKELSRTETYKVPQTAIKSVEFAENKKSAILLWGYRFEQSVKRGFRYVPSFGTVECQELIVMNAWTEKAQIAKSVCKKKMVVTAPTEEVVE